MLLGVAPSPTHHCHGQKTSPLKHSPKATTEWLGSEYTQTSRTRGMASSIVDEITLPLGIPYFVRMLKCTQTNLCLKLLSPVYFFFFHRVFPSVFSSSPGTHDPSWSVFPTFFSLVFYLLHFLSFILIRPSSPSPHQLANPYLDHLLPQPLEEKPQLNTHTHSRIQRATHTYVCSSAAMSLLSLRANAICLYVCVHARATTFDDSICCCPTTHSDSYSLSTHLTHHGMLQLCYQNFPSNCIKAFLLCERNNSGDIHAPRSPYFAINTGKTFLLFFGSWICHFFRIQTQMTPKLLYNAPSNRTLDCFSKNRHLLRVMITNNYGW